ncbi:histidine phosphatase family protein [Aestuariimicrobium sp. T2.26MG-19.2B]|uniref:histidine phosphatase family protein n=1 Tax=Aestuariimicrobium sp. T2.26MG-19.2B TaxID=3040679 RepID=UPI0024774F29|nr:histidine phosphatase family protein [Aestuariimicrobium sp. T2.26MG-19.2B]CAI9407152.1 Putative pterin-4-alpha-carbinolamine dehydratase [Aestuariimicrobium sp. T2.26MG-19.2B]
MRLHLIRHGRTAANVHHLLDTATPGHDLDDEGRAQAAVLVEKLGHRPIEAIYVSPIARTQQTAAPLADALGLTPVVLDGLAEIKAGDLEMWPGFGQYMQVIAAWATGDLSATRPGGEDGTTFISRFDEAIATIVASGHHEAVAVSHAAALGTWLAARAGGPVAGDGSERRLGNTSIITLDGDGDQGWTIVEWDDGASFFQEGFQPGRTLLTRSQTRELAPEWSYVLGRLQQVFRFPDFPTAATFVGRAAEFAGVVDHHPELSLRFDRVHVGVGSHDCGGVTHRDTAMANRLLAIATELGGTTVPEKLEEWEIAIDTMDADAIRPFWQAATGHDEIDGSLVDPLRLGPSIWFQQLDEPRPVRNRIHVDLTVAADEAPARVEAVVAAGGRVVGGRAPTFTILADADGNEVCICTELGRD